MKISEKVRQLRLLADNDAGLSDYFRGYADALFEVEDVVERMERHEEAVGK